jgi:hypothetical protein
MHLIIVKYSSEPERKRVEYILDKWRERLKITKPEGIISIIDGEGLEEFIAELYSRTSRSNVGLYRIEHEAVEIQEGESEIRLKLNENRETVEKLVAFVMAKQKAILKWETKEPFERVYELTTKKGKAEVSVALRDEGQCVSLRMRTTGYGEVVEFLSSRLGEELRYLEGR